MQDYKDGSRLQFIKLDFAAGSKEIKIAILVKLSIEYLSHHFALSLYFFAFVTSWHFSFPLETIKVSIKQAPGHKNMIHAETVSL